MEGLPVAGRALKWNTFRKAGLVWLIIGGIKPVKTKEMVIIIVDHVAKQPMSTLHRFDR